MEKFWENDWQFVVKQVELYEIPALKSNLSLVKRVKHWLYFDRKRNNNGKQN